MPSYDTYAPKITGLVTAIERVIQPIASREYENEHGHSINSVLPDNTDPYPYTNGVLEATLYPKRKEVHNIIYDGHLVSQSNVAAHPTRYKRIVEEIESAWKDAFGEWHHQARQPDHPGECPLSGADYESTMEDIIDEFEIICSDPQLDDLIGTIQDKNHHLASWFLDADPDEVFVPGGGHELSALFTNGDIHVVYKDSEIAVLKPEYNHDLAAGVRATQEQSQRVEMADEVDDVESLFGRETTRDAEVRRLSQMARMDMRERAEVVQNEIPEEAFVVGVDDTPTGLFAHMVDGTRLDVDQRVTREMVNDVMGFDWSYTADIDVLDPEPGERIRMQGDLAVEYLGDSEGGGGAEQSHLPLDNHLVLPTHTRLAPGEDLDTVPVEVTVSEMCTLNITHDEHDEVVTQLVPGEWRWYLLPRGLQPRSERPDWTL